MYVAVCVCVYEFKLASTLKVPRRTALIFPFWDSDVHFLKTSLFMLMLTFLRKAQLEEAESQAIFWAGGNPVWTRGSFFPNSIFI